MILTIELVIYLVIVLSIGVVFLIMSMTRLKSIPYLYANARLSARSRSLLHENKLRNIAESKNLTEFVGSIADTGYFPNIDKKEDLNNIHNAIEKTFYNEVSELFSMSPKQVKPLIESYLVFTESKILKTLYKKRFKKEIINPEDFPVLGVFNRTMLEKVASSESLSDFKVIFANTVYGVVLEKEYGNTLEFENALDLFILEKFTKDISSTKIYDKKIIIDLLNAKYEMSNFLLIIKSITRGEDFKMREKFINLNMTKYAKGTTLEEFVELCKSSRFAKPLSLALEKYKSDGSLFHFEIEMNKYNKHIIDRNDISHYQGSFPIFSYLAKKEYEKNNLFAISKGIDAGFKAKDIMEMLV